MFTILLVFTIAIGVGLGAGRDGGAPGETAVQNSAENGGLLSGTDGNSAYDDTGSDWVPEPQTPTGKFTTATEVKPILTATKANWVAVREYEGKDLLYFTNLLAWRCGLHEIRYGINGASEQVLPFEECHLDTNQPNALKMETHLPFVSLDAGSVQAVSLTVVYDDGSKESVSFARKDILMP